MTAPDFRKHWNLPERKQARPRGAFGSRSDRPAPLCPAALPGVAVVAPVGLRQLRPPTPQGLVVCTGQLCPLFPRRGNHTHPPSGGLLDGYARHPSTSCGQIVSPRCPSRPSSSPHLQCGQQQRRPPTGGCPGAGACSPKRGLTPAQRSSSGLVPQLLVSGGPLSCRVAASSDGIMAGVGGMPG